MTEPHRITFEHDGHHFEATERRGDGGAAPAVRWDVRLDGAPVLEFRGDYPYRDDDVRKRVLEWYAIQKPVAPPADDVPGAPGTRGAP